MKGASVAALTSDAGWHSPDTVTLGRCHHDAQSYHSMNSSLQGWLLLLEQAGLKEFCVQQAFPDCGLKCKLPATFFFSFGMLNLTFEFYPPFWKQWDS